MKPKMISFCFLSVALLLAFTPALAGINQPDQLSATPLGPDWIFETNQAAQTSPDHREMSITADCDVNGDGFMDVLVGKRDYDSLATDNGRAWLFYGSSSGLSATPGRIFDPPYTNTYGFFGTEVACAEVTGDSYDDIFIAMDNYEASYSDEGAVFAWYGAAAGPGASHNWMARGNSTYAHFGASLDNAGDITGDGYEDIIIGANGNDSSGVITAAYVWYGGSGGLGANGLPSNADWVASDNTLAMSFAYVVRGIGDVDGNGYDDVLVGAHNYDGAYTNQGAVYVYYSSSTGLGVNGTTANADWMAMSEQSSAYFGWGVDGVGDVNNDGYADLAVGAYGYDNPETNEGKIFVWYGSASGLGANGTPANADWSAETNNASDLLGFALKTAGDVNADGYADLLATAYGFDPPDGVGGTIAGAGAWFVWNGGPTGLDQNGTPGNADLLGYGDQTNAYLGKDHCSAGDVNQDGRSDIFVLAPYYSNPDQYEGRAQGYYSWAKNYLPFIRQ